jgi:Flp pilus assembly protein TadG
MVEFALVLPLLILLLCAIMDFGWIFFNKLAVANAAREAARYTAVHVNDDGVFDSSDTAAAKTAALASSPVLPDALTVCVSCADGSVTVTVTSPTQVLTGLTSAVFGGSTVDLSAASTMRAEQ